MYYIIPDTNRLFNKYDNIFEYREWKMNKTYYDLLKYRNHENVEILIPKLVIDELIEQKKDAFRTRMDRIRQMEKGSPGLFSVEFNITEEEYYQLISKQVDDFLKSSEGVPVLPVCHESFNNIIADSINKRPPFEGAEKESDKGFKDTVIFYSICEYAKSHHGKYIILTADSQFTGDRGIDIRKRFERETHSELKIFRNNDELFHFLDTTKEQQYYRSVNVDMVKHTRSHTAYPLKNEVVIKQTVPNIVAKNMVESFNTINKEFEDFFTRKSNWIHEMDFFKEKENVGDELAMEFCDEYGGIHKSRILINNYGILSVLFECYDYFPYGCHGVCSQECLVYDVNTGRLIEINELIDMDKVVLFELIKEECAREAHIRGNDMDKIFEKNYHAVEDVHWYVDENGIHIFFDVYEAGCYADGFVEFTIMNSKKTKKYLNTYSQNKMNLYSSKKTSKDAQLLAAHFQY